MQHVSLTGIRSLSIIAALAAAGTTAIATAAYKVTFNLAVPLQNVFVYGYEFNGKVFAWDLFPVHIGNVPAGTSTFTLGATNPTTWAIVGTYSSTGVATSVNDSIDPPDGLPFESVFPGFVQSVVRSQIVGLWNGGYNSQQAFALFNFVLSNEDPLKTDGVNSTIPLYTFSNAVERGTAAFSVVSVCPADLNGSSTVDAAGLAIVLGNWGSNGTGDINADGVVNGADLSTLLGAWGGCP